MFLYSRKKKKITRFLRSGLPYNPNSLYLTNN